jgi:methyl-accepting chemotaxis protein
VAQNNTVQYTITAKDQASQVFSGVAAKVKGSVENIEKGIQNLSKTASAGMGALSGDFSKLGDAIGGIGGPAAAMGAAVVGALGSMITKTMEASEGFRKLSERTGASVEFLSGFTQAADDMFISADTVSASLTIFAKKLGGAEDAMDGSGVSAGAFAKKLQEIGIDSDNVEEALGQVADRFAGMKDGTEKTALAVQLFGKQGVELIPILNKGRDGIQEMTAAAKEMGLVMTTETTQAVTRLKQVLDNLGDRAEGAALNMGACAWRATC